MTAYLSTGSDLIVNEQAPDSAWPVPLTVIGSKNGDALTPENIRGALPALSFDGGPGRDRLSTIPGTPTSLNGGDGDDFVIDRGGDGNQIACGPGNDWVVGPGPTQQEGGFTPRGARYPVDCEHVRLRPTEGRTALVSALAPSAVFVKTPGGEFHGVQYQELVPLGSAVRAPSSSTGEAASAYVYTIAGDQLAWVRVLGSRVSLAQPPGRGGVLTLELLGKPRCNGSTTRKGIDRPRVNVWAPTTGRPARVNTPEAVITAMQSTGRGLAQFVVDRQCGGTLVTMKQGAGLTITRPSGKKVKTLTAGEPYLVRPAK